MVPGQHLLISPSFLNAEMVCGNKWPMSTLYMIDLAYSKDTYKHILLKTMHPKDKRIMKIIIE